MNVPLSIDWQDQDGHVPRMLSRHDFLLKADVLKGSSVASSVFIQRGAFSELIRECSIDTSREHGGILLGIPFRDEDGRFYVVVHRAIPAANTEGSSVHLQFRQESWVNVWNELNQRPDLSVVGWYHTHPGLGVFLSGTDKRTQRRYFSNPWQIAVVVDPIRRKIGFFIGESGDRCRAAIFQVNESSARGTRGASQ